MNEGCLDIRLLKYTQIDTVPAKQCSCRYCHKNVAHSHNLDFSGSVNHLKLSHKSARGIQKQK